MLRPQKLAKGPLKAFKGKEEVRDLGRGTVDKFSPHDGDCSNVSVLTPQYGFTTVSDC